MHFPTVFILGRSTSTVTVETSSSGTPCLSVTASDSDSFCWAPSSTSVSRIVSSTSSSVSFSTSISCEISLTVSTVCSWICVQVPRLWLCRGSLVLRDSLSCVSYTATLARQQPHLNLETHHSATFNRGSATVMGKFWCGLCSCRVRSCGAWRLCQSRGLPTASRL